MPTEPVMTTRKPGRILSIDITRGFALICMVLVHFMIYYGNDEAEKSFFYFFFNDGLADWGAAVFLMMMGMSQVLSAKRRHEGDLWLTFKRILLRGVYLFVVGLIMLILAFGPGEMWRWDILTLMGFATVVLFFCRFLPSWLLLVIVAAIAFSSPLVRGSIDLTAAWGNEFVPTNWISNYLPGFFVDPKADYMAVWDFERIVKGFFLSGYFPVLPWIMFSIIGFVLGRRLVADRLRHDLPFLVIIGALCLLIGAGGAVAGKAVPPSAVVNGYISPLSFYPDSFTMINIQSGMSLIGFSFIFWCYDVRKKDQILGPLARLFSRTSRFSLTFYFSHYMLLGWPLIGIYLVTGKNPIEDFVGAVPALLCGLATIVVLEVALYFWEKAGAKFSLEWILGMLTISLIKDKKA